MKNKRIIDSWNKAEPDDVAKERMLNHIIDRSDRRKKSMPWKPLSASVAACLVLLVGVFVYNRMDTPDQSEIGRGTAVVDTEDLSDEIKGLPVNEFKLSEIQLDIEMDRVLFSDFLSIFEFNPDNFVIVKVADTQSVSAEKTEINDKQKSTVKVLETVWGDTVPDEIDITQYLYGGCLGDEVTNLLRKGGVYLLPLVKDKEKYYLIGDLDVLFEIDDEGRIWSHSDYQDFNYYDGEDYQAVTSEIIRMAQDDTLMLATSDFGKAIREQQLLEVQIISDREEEKIEYGDVEVVYTVRVERALSGENPGTEISVRFHESEEVPLRRDEHYLLFVDNYESKHYVNSNMLAIVGVDGKIQDIGGGRRLFAEYSGYTVEEIAKLADKVTKFLETFQLK